MSAQDETLGGSIRELSQVQMDVGCLEKQLSDIGKHLVALGTALQNDPSDIQVAQGQFAIRGRPLMSGAMSETAYSWQHVPLSVLNASDIQDKLESLSGSTKAHQDLIERLNRMGLGGLSIPKL